MAKAQTIEIPQGFFSDVRRWRRPSPRLTSTDMLLIGYSAGVWVICVLLPSRTVLPSLAHSPMRAPAIWCLAALTAWLALPPLQVLTPRYAIRRALRATVSTASLVTGAAALGARYGAWAAAQDALPLQAHLMQVSLPGAALIVFGLVGLTALRRDSSESEPTGR